VSATYKEQLVPVDRVIGGRDVRARSRVGLCGAAFPHRTTECHPNIISTIWRSTAGLTRPVVGSVIADNLRVSFVMFIVDLLLLLECSTSNVSHLMVHCNITLQVNIPRIASGTLPSGKWDGAQKRAFMPSREHWNTA